MPDRFLTEDEQYLINTYTKIAYARGLYPDNAVRAESLFAAIDSTTDSLRIANTINSINATPDRWVYIFEVIDERLQSIARRRESKNTGRDP